MPQGGQMTERAFRPEITDPERAFESERTRHELSPDRLHGSLGERSLIRREHPFEDRGFAIRRIDRCPVALLGAAAVAADLRRPGGRAGGGAAADRRTVVPCGASEEVPDCKGLWNYALIDHLAPRYSENASFVPLAPPGAQPRHVK